MGKALGKNFHSLELGLYLFLLTNLMLMSSQDICYGKGSGQSSHSLEVLFNLFSVASWEVYKVPLKPVRRVLSCPLPVPLAGHFLCPFYFNKISTTQSYEWLRLSLVPELNLLLRRLQIQWSTVKKVKSFSRVQLFVAPWTVAYQAPVYGIFQARILEWVAISFSRASSQPRV